LKLRDQLNQPTAKETTRQMIATAKAKNGGLLRPFALVLFCT